MPGPSAQEAISASLWTPFATLRLPVKYLATAMEKSLTQGNQRQNKSSRHFSVEVPRVALFSSSALPNLGRLRIGSSGTFPLSFARKIVGS